MFTRNKKVRQRGIIASVLTAIGIGGVFLIQSMPYSQIEALQSINNLTKLSDGKPAVARVPLDYKEINTDTPPQYVESTTDEIIKMVGFMEGDWVRVNSVGVKEFDGIRIYFKPSDDGEQIIGVITELPATIHGEFNRGDIKYKGLKGTFGSGFSIQDKLAKENGEGDKYSLTDIKISPDGKHIEISSGGEHLYTLERVLR
mgnify:CR=1 FL=1